MGRFQQHSSTPAFGHYSEAHRFLWALLSLRLPSGSSILSFCWQEQSSGLVGRRYEFTIPNIQRGGQSKDVLADVFQKQFQSSKHLLQTLDRLLHTFKAKRPLTRQSVNTFDPTSFKVYLGDFGDPITVDQIRELCKCDLLILDALQTHRVDSSTQLWNGVVLPRSVVGRLDLITLPNISELDLSLDRSKITVFATVLEILRSHFTDLRPGHLRFTGILLAGWEDVFGPAELRKLIGELARQGLDVYLEACSAEFLVHPHVIKQEAISGLVLLNGLILPNGQRRDCFDSAGLQPTLDACIAEKSSRKFTIMMWEPLDDGVTISNAIRRRSSLWCQFYSTLLWIAPTSALFDLGIDSGQSEPLSAFDWLKRDDFLMLHEKWKAQTPVGINPPRFSELSNISRYLIRSYLQTLGIC
jgi:hypothetical protein